MRIVMTTRIGGFRNGEPWPSPGEEIDLPAHEAADLVTAGYARPLDTEMAKAVTAGLLSPAEALEASQPPVDLAKAKKPELVAFAEARGLTIDSSAGVRSVRRQIADALAALEVPDASSTAEHDAPPADPEAGPDGVDGPPPIDLDDLDKGELLDLAAEANVSVNPALSEEEIRAVISGEAGIARWVDARAEA